MGHHRWRFVTFQFTMPPVSLARSCREIVRLWEQSMRFSVEGSRNAMEEVVKRRAIMTARIVTYSRWYDLIARWSTNRSMNGEIESESLELNGCLSEIKFAYHLFNAGRSRACRPRFGLAWNVAVQAEIWGGTCFNISSNKMWNT